jgi:hypothetical protein
MAWVSLIKGGKNARALCMMFLTASALGCAPTAATAPPPRYVRYEMAKDKPKADDDMFTIGSAYEVLRREPKMHAGIIGHASADGDAKRNKDLSLRRAQGVRDGLVNQGISGDRLTVAARGSDQPVATNDTEQGRELNRRVEIFFYYPDKGNLQAQYGVKLDIRASASTR